LLRFGTHIRIDQEVLGDPVPSQVFLGPIMGASASSGAALSFQ
jgi:hypothetical protein